MEANQTSQSNGDFTEPTEDPYNKAIGYLEKHNILQLFQVGLILMTNDVMIIMIMIK